MPVAPSIDTQVVTDWETRPVGVHIIRSARHSNFFYSDGFKILHIMPKGNKIFGCEKGYLFSYDILWIQRFKKYIMQYIDKHNLTPISIRDNQTYLDNNMFSTWDQPWLLDVYWRPIRKVVGGEIAKGNDGIDNVVVRVMMTGVTITFRWVQTCRQVCLPKTSSVALTNLVELRAIRIKGGSRVHERTQWRRRFRVSYPQLC